MEKQQQIRVELSKEPLVRSWFGRKRGDYDCGVILLLSEDTKFGIQGSGEAQVIFKTEQYETQAVFTAALQQPSVETFYITVKSLVHAFKID